MSGKLFTRRLAPTTLALTLLWLGPLVGGTGACRGRRALTRPMAAVDTAVRPERFASALRKLGRAHFRCVARFDAGADSGATESVTTETDLWLDEQGNWRLVELNDKDGGREIVLHGRELSVALRYGKMIRRAAEDPEPQRLLEEGIGAPFAAWELLRNVSTVDDFGEESRAGRRVHIYKLTKASRPLPPAMPIDVNDRRAWRQTLFAGIIDGTVAIDDTTGTPLQADFRAQYSMSRPNGTSAGGSGPGRRLPQGSGEATPMHGGVEVHASIEDIGRSPSIARPEAEDTPTRPRTVPEEKALLGGLPRSAPAPVPPPPLRGQR